MSNICFFPSHNLNRFQSTGIFVGAVVVFCQFRLIWTLSKVNLSRQDNALSMRFKIANVGILLLGAVATINSFRSVWYLLDSYFIPGE